MALLLEELKDFLAKEGTKLQLLLGTDPIVRTDILRNQNIANGNFPQDYIKRDIHDLEVKEHKQQCQQL